MKSPARSLVSLLLLLVGLRATGAAPTAPTPAPAPVQPVPATTTQPSSPATIAAYRVAGTDQLAISVYGEPDLNTQARVDAKGNVNLPLINQVKLLDLTISEAEKVIEQAYRDQHFLRNAQVTITIISTRPREISVQGEVRAPGRYPLTVEIPMTVAEAVMKAQGFTETARENAVRVTRFYDGGKRTEVFEVDVGNIIKGRMANKQVNDNSLVLQPDDIIYVDQRIF